MGGGAGEEGRRAEEGWSGVRDRKGEGAHVCLSVFKVMTDGTMKGRGKRNKGKDMGMWWTW